MTHRTTQFVALGGMILMILLYGLTQVGFFGPNQIGNSSTDTNPLIVPATYAFAIWGPIYIGLIAFPVYQLIVNRDNHENWKSLRIWYALNVIANGLWLVVSSYDWLWTSVVIIIFMLFSLFRINQLLVGIENSKSKLNYWLERLVFSLYFAWITRATVLNVASALYFYEWDGFGIAEQSWAVIMLSVAAIIAGFVSRKYRDAAYAGVVVWAFVALVRRHWDNIPTLGYLAAAVVVVFIGIMVLNLRDRSIIST